MFDCNPRVQMTGVRTVGLKHHEQLLNHGAAVSFLITIIRFEHKCLLKRWSIYWLMFHWRHWNPLLHEQYSNPRQYISWFLPQPWDRFPEPGWNSNNVRDFYANDVVIVFRKIPSAAAAVAAARIYLQKWPRFNSVCNEKPKVKHSLSKDEGG